MIRVNLFISSFKRVFKRGCMLVLTLLIVWKICGFLNFVYTNVDGYEWSRSLMHDFYEEDIDCLYLGSSHVFYGVNPSIINELNGKENFNLATFRQRMSGSYYMLQEAIKHHEIEEVYLEMFYSLSTVDDKEITAVWWCSDYMKNSVNRWEMIIDLVSKEQYLESFLPFVRYRAQLFDTTYIDEQLQKKMNEEYRNYSYKEEYGDKVLEYMPRGYYYSSVEIKENELLSKEYVKLVDSPMLESSVVYLEKIIRLCQEKDIKITLYSAPMYELRLLGVENYDAYVEQIRDIATKYGISYYDFNLAKKEYFDIQDVKYFHDFHHLNANGAASFTNFFADVVQNMPQENEKYFYSSYAEKLASEEGRVYGLICVEEDSEQGEIWKIASNRSEGMEYRVFLTPEFGETAMLQDFLTNPYISLPKDEDGICTIVSRRVGEPDSVSTLEVKY